MKIIQRWLVWIHCILPPLLVCAVVYVFFTKNDIVLGKDYRQPYLNLSAYLMDLGCEGDRSYVYVLSFKIEGLFGVLYNITHLLFQLSRITHLLRRMFFLFSASSAISSHWTIAFHQSDYCSRWLDAKIIAVTHKECIEDACSGRLWTH
jgi:hypothetical protein